MKRLTPGDNILVWSLGSHSRRRQLGQDAARSRASRWRRRAALTVVVLYNLVGFADIISTMLAVESGAGEEANPFLRLTMEHAGEGWIAAKLALQAVISFMVLWFPHWIVLGFFTLATAGNAWIVYNNFSIAGVV